MIVATLPVVIFIIVLTFDDDYSSGVQTKILVLQRRAGG